MLPQRALERRVCPGGVVGERRAVFPACTQLAACAREHVWTSQTWCTPMHRTQGQCTCTKFSFMVQARAGCGHGRLVTWPCGIKRYPPWCKWSTVTHSQLTRSAQCTGCTRQMAQTFVARGSSLQRALDARALHHAEFLRQSHNSHAAVESTPARVSDEPAPPERPDPLTK